MTQSKREPSYMQKELARAERAKAKHTPWTVDECEDAHGNITIRPADGTTNGDTSSSPIATVYHTQHAAIIAAAPETAAERDRLKAVNAELLAALKGIRPLFDSDSNLLAVYTAEIEACEAAVAKAEQTGRADRLNERDRLRDFVQLIARLETGEGISVHALDRLIEHANTCLAKAEGE